MKIFACLFAVAVMSFNSSGLLLAEENLPPDEALGKLKLELPAAEVTSLLGKPASKGKETLWDAIGQWVQEWSFPEKGLSLEMASEKKGGAKSILLITATKGCSLTTKLGIRLGSTESEVRKAYGKFEDKESSVAGELFVAGSLYDGVFFTFKEGKVTQIVIGAIAE